MSLTPHRLPLDAPPVGRVISTFNAYHLGDNLLALHYLRAQAKAHPEIHFSHAAAETYLPQLAPLTVDLPNLSLHPLATSVPNWIRDALNTWLGADGWFYGQPDRHDFVAVYLRHFARLSAALGLPSPFTTARDLLFDYSALEMPPADGGVARLLVVNSPPQSGQFQSFSHEGFDRVIALLDAAGHNVITTSPSLIADIPCTQAQRMDVTAIGRLAQRCTAIIGVPTGPMWPTFNVWNANTTTLRLLLLDTEQVNLLPEHTVHANHLSLVPELLKDRGLL